MRKFVVTTLAAAGLAVAATGSMAAEGPGELQDVNWSWEGIFGTYDIDAARRGFEVFDMVCGNCHGLGFVAYRNLQALGYSEDEVKEIAARREVQDGFDDFGDPLMRPALPSDRFVPPFENEAIARMANNGALPPDLSLMTKARMNGANYVYSLMLGYHDEPPEGVELMPGMYYNDAFPGHQIAMPPQLFEGMVAYADGTEATPEQMALDITTFLNWAAEPELGERKSLGVKVMLFLLVFTGMLYALKRKIWADVH